MTLKASFLCSLPRRIAAHCKFKLATLLEIGDLRMRDAEDDYFANTILTAYVKVYFVLNKVTYKVSFICISVTSKNSAVHLAELATRPENHWCKGICPRIWS